MDVDSRLNGKTMMDLVGSGGTNGLTNYIDRDVDARMQRVKHRPLPSRKIYPPQKMLPWAISLVIGGLIIAWFLDPLCFAFGAFGVAVAITWRKKITCAFPQGAIAGCSPVIIGYAAISQRLDLTLIPMAKIAQRLRHEGGLMQMAFALRSRGLGHEGDGMLMLRLPGLRIG